MSGTHVEKIAEAVARIEAAGQKQFLTTAIKYLAARTVSEAFRGQVHTPLSNMRCLTPIDKGGDNNPAIWEITEPPGHICFTCNIAPRPKQRSICARRTRAGLPVRWEPSSRKMYW